MRRPNQQQSIGLQGPCQSKSALKLPFQYDTDARPVPAGVENSALADVGLR